jgi:hypothetical protein
MPLRGLDSESSCRGFHLCPSCSQKRFLLFSEYLDEQLLLALPHRQAVQWPAQGFVFTIPEALRAFLRDDQGLFGLICRLIFSLIAEFCSAAAAKPISSAALPAYQPFGDALRFDPHFHALILEGGFDPNGRFAETLLCWRHSGFSVDNSVRLDSGRHTARQALAHYIARAPLSLQKLTYDRAGGKVLYHTPYNPYFKQNPSLWSATDFIAHLTPFIPPWGVRSIHHFGLYSSRCKARWHLLPHIVRVAPQGWRQSHAETMSPQAEAAQPTTVSHAACRPAWTRLIAKVYERDLSGGSGPRSGQREPLTLSPVWLRDETRRGHHQPRRGTQDPASSRGRGSTPPA